MREEDYTMPCAFLGAPLIAIEKILTGTEVPKAIETMRMLSDYYRKATSLSLLEIGGLNGMTPMYTGAQLGLPILDCDYMGRAYPEVQMCSNFIYGKKGTPVAMADEKNNKVILMQVENDRVKGST